MSSTVPAELPGSCGVRTFDPDLRAIQLSKTTRLRYKNVCFVLVSAGQSSCLVLNVDSSAFLLSGKCPIGTASETFFQGLVRHDHVMDP